ncbi:PP2C family protein-serine/threonine phosphatase [Fundidesulfovibrio agrisoli]|uniref:PP2C family protein-serine/threonine phosphatase n=1 Tax=Fundidesulfovibrio agrisoli TaxID=2922717 RepID=UPI001FACA314|nr:SpoIIE family protein phosphatase [Fundidesulfovibrio agrisoli]
MESLPPVELGAIIFGAYAAVLSVRSPLLRLLVDRRHIFVQVGWQFGVDFCLGLAAGLLAVAFNSVVHGFPFFSGVKLFLGMTAVAFFLSMDAALGRQRAIIATACRKSWHKPPAQVRPLARKLAVVATGSTLLVAALLTLILNNAVDWLATHASGAQALGEAKRSVMVEVVFVTTVLVGGVIGLILRYSENLRRLLQEQTVVLDAVSQGRLDRFIPVATADEFGVIAARTNSMIEGLRHRVSLMNALDQAQAVQRSLLPGKLPVRPGLDIAAAAVYSGQTGGDYYDFLELAGDSLAVVVADVSGHGMDSALLMASARGFLRQAALCLSDTSRIVTTLNRHLARDVAGAGHFITMFMLVLDPARKTLEWVRAGHDPAIVYNPDTDAFSELKGRGLPLAVDPESAYLPERMRGWPSGCVMVLGTDGLWEAFGPDGSMYGKDRLRAVIRANATLPAQAIMEAIAEDWHLFLDGAPQEDDVTLVVIRFVP